MDIYGCCCFLKVFLDPDLDKPEPNTFYLWPQKTPLGREQLGLELVAERLGAERQNNTDVKNLFL
jgi:hypothetical protein